jgi:thiol-disulfide isomerase/thioredoxin
MANRQRAEARRKAAAKAARSGEGGSKLWMWAGLAVIIVVAAIVAVVAASGDDKAIVQGSGTSDSVSGPGALPDSQPVKIDGAALPSFTATEGDTAVGMTAPTLEGSNFTGGAVKADAADGAYMLVFLAHWCPHCNAEIPKLLDWKHSGAVPADLRVIGVATAVDSTQDNYPPGQWISNRGWEWPVLVDEFDGARNAGKGAQAYGATGWPYFVIVGTDGKVKVRYSGEIEAAELEKLVAAALAS